jgi:phenylalanyl-tRNA synthetase alpha chain
MNSLEQLATIREEFSKQLQSSTSYDELEQQLLGRKGSLTAILRSLSEMPLAERKVVSQKANELKNEISQALAEKRSAVQEHAEYIDITAPPLRTEFGSIHPISAIIEEMTGIFRNLSFEVVEGNELVTEKENFETLNIGPDHPSRDGHDSFFIEGQDSIVLRTQTTAVQVLEMAKRFKRGEMPIRIVVPGKTYRRESDQTHSPMFHQMDAVLVDNQTTFSDLKGCLDYFAKSLFGDTVETRFRPHYFPFTEPSAEMDIRWKGKTSGEGKHTGWLEFGGCGMIHPEVLRRAGINPKIYQGWAFGMSIERPLMIRHQISDLRRLYDNAIPFLNQFSDQL